MQKVSAFIGLLIFSTATVSAPYSVTGTVQVLRSHDTAYGIDGDWFSLTGISSAGACLTSSGLVVIRIRDDQKGQRHFAMPLAAKSAGSVLTVAIDDSVRDQYGYCYLRYME